MKKITVALAALAFSASFVGAQTTQTPTKPAVFDEAAAYQEAINKGIPESDRRGYVERYLKPKFYSKQNQTYNYSTKQYSYTAEDKTMRINLTPPHINNANCPNAEFEQLDFSSWSSNAGTIAWPGTATWSGSGLYGPTNSIPNSNWSADIMTTPPGNNNPGVGAVVGYDPIAINPTSGLADIPLVSPNGGISSVRLGNSQVGAETERLIYSMTVSPANAQFTYQYAVVLQDPNHATGEQPFFKVTMKDQNGNPLAGCGQYQVDATLAASDPTYVSITYQFEPLYYKPWTIVSVDLSAYIGQTITIEFQTADCTQTGHFGYAYIDGSCGIIQGYVNGFCTGSTQVLLTAPTGFTAYQWSGPNSLTPIPGGTDDSIIVNNPNLNDTFFVQMVNAAGCTTVVMTIITPSTLGVQNMSSTPTCPGGATGTANVIPYGGLVSGYNFIWSSSVGGAGTVYGTTQTVGALPEDTVWVNITSGNCPPKDTFIIINNQPPPPTLTNINFCTNPIYLNVASTGLNYQWYNYFGGTTGGNNDSIYVPAPFNGEVYSVGFNDSVTGCRDSVRFTLVQQTFNFTANATDACIGGANGTIGFNATNGFSPYTFDVTGPNSFTSTATSASATYFLNSLAPGTYTAIVNTAGCTDTVNITVDSILISSVPTPSPACYGGTTGSVTLTSTSPGMQPYTYSITGPVTLTNTNSSTTYTFTTLPTGTYTVSVSALSGNCLYDSVITVTENPPPLTTSTDDICPNDTTSLVSQAPAGTHQWYLPDGTLIAGATGQTYLASPAVFGTYIDTLTDPNGCINIHQLTITQTAFSSSASVVNNPCYQDSVASIAMSSTGGGVSPYTYNWTGPNGFTSTSPSKDSLLSGTYTIYSHSGNCKDTTVIVITEPGPPEDTLVITTSFCEGDTSAILAAPVGYTNYQWYYNGVEITGATNDSIFILNPESTYNNYSVTYIIFPCERKSVVVFKSTPGTLFTPDLTTNIFSPNGDNKNEYFHPYYNPLIDMLTGGEVQKFIDYASADYNIKIFNRWGQLMFESTDYSKQWNGKTPNNKDCDEGTYFWIATYKSRCGSGEYTTQKGYVQLIR